MDDVEIVPYDPVWETLFAVEAQQLRAALDPRQVLGIEHFGSTAVPGLASKPIIDILIAVTSLAQAKVTMVEAITALGYVYWAENPKTDRMFFVKGMPPYGERRTHHVHITEPDGEMWRHRLPFRDYLRANPDEARRYEVLKRDLAARYSTDRERYTDAKTEYVETVYRKMGLLKRRGDR
jgi:GrpB-like predicted nucleotidyltransferase (UPF0157 family)